MPFRRAPDLAAELERLEQERRALQTRLATLAGQQMATEQSLVAVTTSITALQSRLDGTESFQEETHGSI